MLIHFNKCEFGGSVAETWKALQEAKSAGQARSIGVSHFTISDLEKLSGDKPSVNQCSLSVRFHDDETIEYCRQHNITYMSFSPLCGGANGSSCPYGSVLTIPEVIAVAQAHKVRITSDGNDQTCCVFVLNRKSSNVVNVFDLTRGVLKRRRFC